MSFQQGQTKNNATFIDRIISKVRRRLLDLFAGKLWNCCRKPMAVFFCGEGKKPRSLLQGFLINPPKSKIMLLTTIWKIFEGRVLR